MFWRYVFFIFVVLTAICASTFMVFECAQFYGSFYPGKNGFTLGFVAAFLNESFLAIMSAVWLPAKQFGRFRILHPGNLWIKLLMLFLFINTVGGASYHVINDKLNDVQNQSNIIKVLELREKQLSSAQKKLEIFIQQNQRVNTAIAAKELEKVQEEIAQLNAQKKSTLTLWSDIFLLSFLRFSIQLSNITAIALASMLYRQIRNQEEKKKEKIIPISPYFSAEKTEKSLLEQEFQPMEKAEEKFSSPSHASSISSFSEIKGRKTPPLMDFNFSNLQHQEQNQDQKKTLSSPVNTTNLEEKNAFGLASPIETFNLQKEPPAELKPEAKIVASKIVDAPLEKKESKEKIDHPFEQEKKEVENFSIPKEQLKKARIELKMYIQSKNSAVSSKEFYTQFGTEEKCIRVWLDESNSLSEEDWQNFQRVLKEMRSMADGNL